MGRLPEATLQYSRLLLLAAAPVPPQEAPAVALTSQETLGLEPQARAIAAATAALMALPTGFQAAAAALAEWAATTWPVAEEETEAQEFHPALLARPSPTPVAAAAALTAAEPALAALAAAAMAVTPALRQLPELTGWAAAAADAELAPEPPEELAARA